MKIKIVLTESINLKIVLKDILVILGVANTPITVSYVSNNTYTIGCVPNKECSKDSCDTTTKLLHKHLADVADENGWTVSLG